MSLTFADITAGTRLAGVVPNAAVTVAALQVHGPESATPTYRTAEGTSPSASSRRRVAHGCPVAVALGIVHRSDEHVVLTVDTLPERNLGAELRERNHLHRRVADVAVLGTMAS